jgi:DNA helicase-2/ATP-dependent DNA helicase PcrA
VDEYQDINLAQYRLLRLLAGPETNLCAIGDPDQAIYGFRGADRAYFLSFTQDFPGAKTLHLSQNYRSTQLILDASSQVIAKSPASQLLHLHSNIIDPTRLELYQALTEQAEAEYVVHQIEKALGGLSYFSRDSGRVGDDEGIMVSRSFADFAVFYRLGMQSQPLIEAFERSGIPYQSAGQTPFYERKEIKQILAYLWFSYNPHSRVHLENILNARKERFKPDTLDQLMLLAERHNLAVGEVVQQFEEIAIFDAAQQQQLRLLTPFLSQLKEARETQPLPTLIELIAQFMAKHQLASLDDKQVEQIRQLRLKALPFENRLKDFLETTVLQKETDAYEARADRVTLMTLHASKGLEFPVVFMVGCEETLLPYQRQGQEGDLEEERRLFYVGMTRARQKLILTHAKTRFLFGREYKNEPSRFLNDIENTLKEIKRLAARKPVQDRQDNLQLKLF